MTKAEINQALSRLLNQEPGKLGEEEFSKLNTAYAELKKQSEDQQLQDFINGGGDSVEFKYTADEEDVKFKDLSTTFSQRIEKVKSEKESSSQAVLEERKKITAELKSIAKTDVKNLGKNFRTANDLRARWAKLPQPTDEESVTLENDYKHLLDTFYYDAKIVKDAIELDYQKNFEAKKGVIEKINSLKEEKDVRTLEQKIRQYEREWFRVGPVKRELRDDSKKELEDAIAALQPQLDELYKDQQELLEENLKSKINIAERLNQILDKTPTSPKQYQQAAEKVIALQNEWKEIGRSKENDKIWELFSGATDVFFEQKREFFKNLSTHRKENKEQKQQLIDKALAVKDSTDWKKTSSYLIDLQQQWKQIGPAHPAEDQKLWVKFRGACDVFFNAKKEHFKERDKEFVVNLEQKQQLIEEVKSFVPSGNVGKDMNSLQGFEKRYQTIGFVPFKQKDKIHKAFYGALNGFYSELKVDRQEKDKMRYENRVKSMATGRKPDRTLDFERNKIQQELQELKTKLAQYQNNVNIVSSGKDNPLVKMIQKNLRDTEKEIERKEMQLSLIKDAKSGKLSLEEE